MDDVVKLYSTGCPRCKVLITKMDNKDIKYDVISDESVMEEMGIQSVPQLEVNGTLMEFGDANRWINEQ